MAKNDTKDPAHAPKAEPPTPSRRFFLQAGTAVVGAGLVGAVAIPATRFIGFPLDHEVTSSGAVFVGVGRRDMFGAEPVKVDIFADRVDAWNRSKNVKIGSAWVLEQEGELVALSTRCPHLGCAIDWDTDSGVFACACHDSTFARDGRRHDGPSPRGMDGLEVEDSEGLIRVRYRRFKQGIEEKETL